MPRSTTALSRLLVPSPRSVRTSAGSVSLTGGIALEVAGGDGRMDPAPALTRLRTALDVHAIREAPDAPVALRLRPHDAEGPEAYRLRVMPRGIEIAAADTAGWRHGAATLAQWLRLNHDPASGTAVALPAIEIGDRPDFRHRGVMLDISRDKVPTMATLLALVDRLADWKINQLQLYTEHTFAYPGHEDVWQGASPLTAADVRTLDAHCRQRGIELVPNQNSFGHFHRWLVHPRYRPLAECPDGVDHPFSTSREPFSLCATDPRSLDLVAELYDALLPCFTSRQLNVGLDETFDLGQCRSADACAARGRTGVYLDFVRAVHRLAAARGRRIQMWGDIVLKRPEHLGELPEDVVALAWGYEADHPFDVELPRLAAAGRAFYVCPGTSSWLSFGGRVSNTLANLASAARHGREAGAAGYLVTDWGDQGHWQPLPVSYPGLLVGASLAWNADAPVETDALAPLLDVHAFDLPPSRRSAHRSPGRALVALGELYRATGTPSRNGSALFHLLMAPHDDLTHDRYAGLSGDGLAAARDQAADAAQRASQCRADARTRRELGWAADLVALGAEVGLARLEAGPTTPVDRLSAAIRRRLAARLEQAVGEHGPVWRGRNRAGGRLDSLARIAPLADLLGARGRIFELVAPRR